MSMKDIHTRPKAEPVSPQNPDALTLASILGYASGSSAIGVINAVPTLLFLFFVTQIVGIAPATAAVIVLLPKLWVIVWDPFVGTWSDRVTTRWGRRIPFMLVGTAISITAFAALFGAPPLSYGARVAWVSATYFALMCGYSLFAVPYLAVPTEITEDDRDRSRLVRWRMSFAMAGSLLGSAGAPLIVQAGGGDQGGYRVMGLVVGAICFAGMAGPIAMLRSRHATHPAKPQRAGAERMFARTIIAMGDRPFRSMALSHILQVTAVGALTSGLPFLVTRGEHRAPGDVGAALFAYLLPSVFAIPFWALVARASGDAWAQAMAALLYGAGAAAVGMAVAQGAPWVFVLALMPLLGFGFGGLQGQSFTIIARIIHRAAGGQAQASFTGIWTAAERLGLALGPSLTGVALAIWGGSLAPWTAVAAPILVLASLPFLLDATQASRRTVAL